MRPNGQDGRPNGRRRSGVPKFRLVPRCSYVVNGENLKCGESKSECGELTYNFAAIWRTKGSAGRRVIQYTSFAAVPARQPYHGSWWRLDLCRGTLLQLAEQPAHLGDAWHISLDLPTAWTLLTYGKL